MRALRVAAELERPARGIQFSPGGGSAELAMSSKAGWVSPGGPRLAGLERAATGRLTVKAPEVGGECTRLSFTGIFALISDLGQPAEESAATIKVEREGGHALSYTLRPGYHYRDARDLVPIHQTLGDGLALMTSGGAGFEGEEYRVDTLSIDLPRLKDITEVAFCVNGASAAFVIFDVVFEFENSMGCPFHHQSRGVSLDELAAVIRIGDRPKFDRAVRQLSDGLLKMEHDLDEARGTALTFLSVISAALLELGAPREMHLFLLRAARSLDGAKDLATVSQIAMEMSEEATRGHFRDEGEEGDPLIRRALTYIDRHFARDLTDEVLADHLGLSTSHFRFLFKKSTGQPFQKYLMGLRLEKARRMLLDLEVTVAEVARACGFVSAAHFSRTFSHRFGCPPTEIKQSGRRVGAT